MRTSVYIDGFNLYYRALKGTAYKWLDLKKLVALLLPPAHQITEIKYFTAIVSGSVDPNQPNRQKAYIRALQQYTPGLTVHYGHFLTHTVRAPNAPPTQPPTFVNVIKTEEKGSDVNLAVHLLNDAWKDVYDCAVIISNDSDFAEALRLVKEQNGKKIGIISPVIKGHPSHELIKYADFVRRIRKGALAASQLPSPIPGTNIHKPANW
ncbi:MAG: NYN domain-containing protein [Firmicutes bacterium]|nr:NYN domain-containing protein [Bacillota bacterium]